MTKIAVIKMTVTPILLNGFEEPSFSSPTFSVSMLSPDSSIVSSLSHSYSELVFPISMSSMYSPQVALLSSLSTTFSLSGKAIYQIPKKTISCRALIKIHISAMARPRPKQITTSSALNVTPIFYPVSTISTYSSQFW